MRTLKEVDHFLARDPEHFGDLVNPDRGQRLSSVYGVRAFPFTAPPSGMGAGRWGHLSPTVPPAAFDRRRYRVEPLPVSVQPGAPHALPGHSPPGAS